MREKKKGWVQEEGLGSGQRPVPVLEFLRRDVRAGNAQRDDLASQERKNEAPRP